MAEKFNVTGEQHYGITGQLFEIQRQIRLTGGSPLDPELVKLALQDIIEGKFNRKEKIKISLLSPLSVDENMIIEASDGKAMIGKADKTFKSYIDGDFKNWGLNKSGAATEETAVKGYELIKDANLATIFGSFNNLDEACFTQAQVIRFCEKYPRQLRQDGYANFFLIKENGEYFVADVLVYSGGLSAYVYRLDDDFVWYADYRLRVFVPATCTLAA